LNTAVSGFTIKKWHTGINDVKVYNNIFQTTSGVPLISIPVGYSAFFAGNLYWTSGSSFKIKYQGVTYYNLTNWRAASGNEKLGEALTGLVANPILSNAGKGGTLYPLSTEALNAYKVTSTSPAVNSGLNLAIAFGINSGALDYFGNVAPYEAAPEIGAAERSSVATREDDHDVVADDNILSTGINMFPNPVHGDSVVKLRIDAHTSSRYTIEVFSATGLLIWQSANQNLDLISIPTHSLESGIYLVRIIDDSGKTTTSKLVVE
jgi:hypothetical protein